MIRASILLAIAATVPAPATAQAPMTGRSDSYRWCMEHGDAARGNTTAIDLCVASELILQDDRLDRAYRRAGAHLGWPTKLRLVTAQRRWVVDSNDRCAKAAGLDPRAGLTGAIYNDCILNETIARADRLEHYTPE